MKKEEVFDIVNEATPKKYRYKISSLFSYVSYATVAENYWLFACFVIEILFFTLLCLNKMNFLVFIFLTIIFDTLFKKVWGIIVNYGEYKRDIRISFERTIKKIVDYK